MGLALGRHRQREEVSHKNGSTVSHAGPGGASDGVVARVSRVNRNEENGSPTRYAYGLYRPMSDVQLYLNTAKMLSIGCQLRIMWCGHVDLANRNPYPTDR
eukprot:6462676-Prymnesium_polylepis.1